MTSTPAPLGSGGPTPPRASERPAPAAPAASAAPAAKPAAQDDYVPASRPENWRVESTTTHQVFERLKQAQGQEQRVTGQKVTEDSKQTNLDTGEVIQMHAEETVEGKSSKYRQDFRQFDGAGRLRTEAVTERTDDGDGKSTGREVVSRFGPDGKPTEKTTHEWEKKNGQLVNEKTLEER